MLKDAWEERLLVSPLLSESRPSYKAVVVRLKHLEKLGLYSLKRHFWLLKRAAVSVRMIVMRILQDSRRPRKTDCNRKSNPRRRLFFPTFSRTVTSMRPTAHLVRRVYISWDSTCRWRSHLHAKTTTGSFQFRNSSMEQA